MSGSLRAELLTPNTDVFVEKTINNWAFSGVGNKIEIEYPNNRTEIYYYRRADNSLVLSLRLIYTSSSKSDLETIERIA